MILKGNQRGGATQLAGHLLKAENEHVEVHEIRGFVADDLHGAFSEAYAISKGTKCQQFLFSLSLNPPQEESVSVEAFERAADAAEQHLGLTDQPRAIVFHEKEGRRHAHVVWSRIDAQTMTARNMAHYKTKLTALSKELYLEHGWDLPDGLRDRSLRDPLNFTRGEWQQALRAGRDPREIKQVFSQAWRQSDGAKAFKGALQSYGFILARGDRRGYVAVDYTGEIYAVARYAGVRTKEVKARLDDPADLPSVEEAKQALRDKLSPRLKAMADRQRDKQAEQHTPLTARKKAMAKAHKAERQKLKAAQAKRWQAETQERQARLRKGLAGLWDWASGKAKQIRQENELAAWDALKRDQKQRDGLIADQLKDRRALQREIQDLRKRHLLERIKLDRDIGAALSMDPDKLKAQYRMRQMLETRRARKRDGVELGR